MVSSSEESAARFLENLAAAIRFKTVSDEEGTRDDEQFRLLHELLAERFPLVYERCFVETVNHFSLLITWEGQDDTLDPLLVMAHHDVVPVEPGTEPDWPVPPFSGEVGDGYIWGRGAADDKGALIAMLQAVDELLEEGFQPRRTVLVVSGHDEELGGLEGSKRVAELLEERNIRPWLVLDEGGAVASSLPRLSEEPVAMIRTSEKGSMSLRLTARSGGGHSSVPSKKSAVPRLLAALQKLDRKRLPARVEMIEPTFEALRPGMGRIGQALFGNLRLTGPVVERILAADPVTDASIRTTMAITRINAGVKENVIPAEATATLNFRIIPGDTEESVLRHVRRMVGDDIKVEITGGHADDPSPVSSTTSEAWRTVTGVVESAFPGTVCAPWTLVAVTDARHFSGIAGDVYGFTPFTFDEGDFERLHGTGERLRVDDAARAVEFYKTLYQSA